MVRFSLIAGLLMGTSAAAQESVKEVRSDLEGRGYHYVISCKMDYCLSHFTFTDQMGSRVSLSAGVSNHVRSQKGDVYIDVPLSLFSPWHDKCEVIINRELRLSGDMDTDLFSCRVVSDAAAIFTSHSLHFDFDIRFVTLDVRTYDSTRPSEANTFQLVLTHESPDLPQQLREVFGTTDIFEIYEQEIGVVLHGDPRTEDAYFEYLNPNSSEQE